MIGRRGDAHRGQLLATVRLQYPDTLAERGFRLLHPVTGDRYTGEQRHLVATCRSVANFAMGAIADGPEWCLEAASHGLTALRDLHHDPENGGYHLVVDADGTSHDETRSAYGHAFVLLAFARAAQAGLADARDDLAVTHDLIEERFRDERGLLRSDCEPDWTVSEPYRGQNANMHACEAYLAAYEATEDSLYLDPARHIAGELTVALAAETDGLLWEHYTVDWDHDFAYNRDEPRHQFRPPGYQPGHHFEWAKLLGLLDRYETASGTGSSTTAPETNWYARAVDLFEAAIDLGWTGEGFAYTVEADGDIIVPDRYGWALAEGIGAAAVLAERADARDDPDRAHRFGDWQQRFLTLVDDYRGPAGLWYEKRLAEDDGSDPVPPSPPGVEPDYHPAGAFFESWRSAEEVTASE